MNTITCPHCSNFISVDVSKSNYVYIEGFCKYENGSIYSPRDRQKISQEKVKESVNFILKRWSSIVYVIVYDKNGHQLNRYAKLQKGVKKNE